MTSATRCAVRLPPLTRGQGERDVAAAPDRERLHVVRAQHDDHDLRVVLPEVGLECRRPAVVVAPREARVLESLLHDADVGIGREHVPQAETEVLADGVPDREQRQRVGNRRGLKGRGSGRHHRRRRRRDVMGPRSEMGRAPEVEVAPGPVRRPDHGRNRGRRAAAARRRATDPASPQSRVSVVDRPGDPQRAGDGGYRAQDRHRDGAADADLARLRGVVELISVECEPDPETDQADADDAARRRPPPLVCRLAFADPARFGFRSASTGRRGRGRPRRTRSCRSARPAPRGAARPGRGRARPTPVPGLVAFAVARVAGRPRCLSEDRQVVRATFDKIIPASKAEVDERRDARRAQGRDNEQHCREHGALGQHAKS